METLDEGDKERERMEKMTKKKILDSKKRRKKNFQRKNSYRKLFCLSRHLNKILAFYEFHSIYHHSF